MPTRYLATAATLILVSMLGGLAGWYVYVRTHTDAIRSADAARGFSSGTGSFGNIGGGVLGGTPGLLSGGNSTGTGAMVSALLKGSGAQVGFGIPVGDTTVATSSPESSPTTPRYWKAVQTPVAGFGFVSDDAGTYLWYVERATGHLFSLDLWGGEIERLSNTLLPKTHAAQVAQGHVLIRRIDDGSVTTFVGSPERTATSTALQGTELAEPIRRITLDPAQGNLFYIRTTASGSEGVSADPDGTDTRVIFSSPLRGWEPIALANRRFVQQLPADGVLGAAYEVSTKGVFTRLVEPGPGLMILPRASSTNLLWSTVTSSRPSLFGRTTPTGDIARFSLPTIAAKCAWAAPTRADTAYCAVPREAASVLPLDSWLQGAFHTSDAWWLVDVSSGASQALYAAEDGPDVRAPHADPSGRWIAFLDGRDESLWVLRIVQ